MGVCYLPTARLIGVILHTLPKGFGQKPPYVNILVTSQHLSLQVPMRPYALPALILLTACSSEPNHLGNPLLWPFNAVGTAAENAIYQERRGRVEVIVKSNWPMILDEIMAGEGPSLTQAMNAARIPEGDRAARITQMQGDFAIYDGQPEALVVALMVYGR